LNSVSAAICKASSVNPHLVQPEHITGIWVAHNMLHYLLLKHQVTESNSYKQLTTGACMTKRKQ